MAGPTVLILADDFTGAADAAAPFAAAGLCAAACLRRPIPVGPAVIALSTGSRGLVEPDALAAVREAVSALQTSGASVCLQKIDSTLRGHPSAEAHAALRAWGLEEAVIAPAFPAQGRTTVGGVHRVHGAAIADLRTAFAWPGAQVADAESDEDLDAVVAAHPLTHTLWVGSGGLAAALARATPGRRRFFARRRPSAAVIAICGSRQPVAAEQREAFVRVRRAFLWSIAEPADCARTVEAESALRQGTDVVVAPLADVAAVPGEMAAALGAAAARLISAVPCCGVLATGGDTATAVLRTVGAAHVVLDGEVEPGLPCGTLPNGTAFACKAGGFGDALALHRAACWLRGEGGA